MARLVVAVAAEKGGVGKTTTAVNLACALVDLGYSVALVDADAQGSATYSLGLLPGDQPGFDTWLDGEDALIRGGIIPLVPGGPDTAYYKWESTQPLKHALDQLDVDLVLIDSPPTLGATTVAILSSANRVLAPVTLEPLVMLGLAQVLKTLAQVNPCPVDVLRCRHKPRLRLTAEIEDQLAQGHTAERFTLLKTTIPDAVAVAEATGQGVPLLKYAPVNNSAVLAYRQLAEEIVKHWSLARRAY